jgi:hypothetical protein
LLGCGCVSFTVLWRDTPVNRSGVTYPNLEMPASGQMEKYFSREPYYIPPAVRFINGSRCLKRIGCWNNSSEDLRETEIQRASCAVLARVDAGGHARPASVFTVVLQLLRTATRIRAPIENSMFRILLLRRNPTVRAS